MKNGFFTRNFVLAIQGLQFACRGGNNRKRCNRIIILLLFLALPGLSACQGKDVFDIEYQQKTKVEQPVEELLAKPEQNYETNKIEEAEAEKAREAKRAERAGIIADRYEGNYAFEQLTDEEKITYNEILSTIVEQKEGIDLSTHDTSVMKKAYSAVNADYGSLFWVEGYSFTEYKQRDSGRLHFVPSYTMTKAERSNYQEQLDAVVNEWLSGVSLVDSDYTIMKYVYETIINNTDYVVGAANNQNIISVFLNRESVCQGYAAATQYMLRQLGIESTIVTGRANNEAHAWNLVELDGAYYYLDTTWGNSTYLDEGSKEEKFVNYNYLGMTTDELLLTHSPDVEFTLPECTSTENNYYVKENRYIDRWQAEAIGSIFGYAWENKTADAQVSLKFASQQLYDQALDYFISQQKIYEYCAGLKQFLYFENSEMKALTISFE